MTNLDPQMLGVLTYATEKQLVVELTGILNEEIATYGVSARPSYKIDAEHLEEVIGRKFAYLVARRCRFTRIGGWWVRKSPSGEVTVEIDVDDLAPAMREAVGSLDPLKLLKPLMVGALNV